MAIFESIVEKLTREYNRVKGEAKAFDWTHTAPEPALPDSLKALDGIGVEPTRFDRGNGFDAEPSASRIRPLARTIDLAPPMDLTPNVPEGTSIYDYINTLPPEKQAQYTAWPAVKQDTIGEGLRGLVSGVRSADAALGREFASPFTGATPLNPAGTKGHLLGGEDRSPFVKIVRGFVEEGLRPSSLAAMAVPVVKGGSVGQRVLKNALAQGGANVALDLLMGRTNPKQLALSAGLGAGLGGGLPEVGTATRALRRYGKTPEGKALIARLQSDRGSLDLPDKPGPEGNVPERPASAGDATLPAPETRPLSAQEAAVPPLEAKPVEPATGGGEPPVPPTPPTAVSAGGELPPSGGDVLPPVNARFATAMREATLNSPAERARLLKEGRARQFGGAGDIIAGPGDLQSRLSKVRGRMRTGTLLPEMQGVGEKFTVDDLKQLSDQIDNAHATKRISSAQWQNAADAFQRITLGGRQLEPAEKKLLGTVFGPEFEAALPTTQRQWNLWNEAVGVMGLPQTFATSFDLSAPFRQGGVLGAGNPKEWTAAWPAMIKAAQSEEGAAAVMKAVDDNPWVKGVGELDGYGFRDVGGHISDLSMFTEATQKEGQFASLNNSYISRAARMIPGIRQSERGFTVFLNKLRGDVYGKVAGQMWDGGVRDMKQYRDLAAVINHGTGYGAGPIGRLFGGVNAFFSPRNLTARFQVLMDPFTKSGSLLKPSARQLAAKNLVSFVGINGTLVSLLAAAGVGTVTWDPRRTDFGKLVSGDTRLDPWGGYSPLARLVAQETTGQRMSYGGVISDADRKKLAVTFVRGKLGPVPSLIVDMFAGKSGIGEKTDLTSAKGIRTQLYNRMVPFFAQDMTDAIKAEGLKGGLLTTPAGFGMGVLTYPPSEKGTAYDYIAKSGYDDAGDELWKTSVTSGAFPQGYGSFNDFRDALIKEVSKDGTDPLVAEAFVDALPAIKGYKSELMGYRTHLRESDPELTKALLTAGLLQPSASNVGALAVP